MKENNKYIKTGLMIFSVLTAAILVFFVIYNLSSIMSFLGKVIHILSSVIIGVVVAYLLNPVVNALETGFLGFFSHFKLSMRTRKKLSKGIAITITMLAFIALITVLISFVMPELIDCFETLADNITSYVNIVYAYIYENIIENYIYKTFEEYPDIKDSIDQMFGSSSSSIINWFTVDLKSGVTNIVGKTFTGIVGTVKGLINTLLGLCVSVYLLATKSSLLGQAKKLLFSRFKKENVNVFLAVCRQVDSIFGGFISGKLLDSLIIGVLCFIGVSIFDMPYKILLSVVIGVTNVIPIFGPWIGAVPCTLLVLIADPQKALIFAIFVLVLQQFDGNILGPNILGDSTGLSAFWVVVAITLGGGLFGVIGMLLGVPTFATIYFLIKTYTEFRLKQKSMPIESVAYTRVKRIDPESGNAEFLNTSMSKREKRKQGTNEKDVSAEIEIAAKMSRQNREERKIVKESTKDNENEITKFD